MLELKVECERCGKWSVQAISQDAGASLSCPQCKASMLRYEPVRGYVYMLSNDQMPGLIKVGITSRPVEERVSELNSSTAVPASFIIEAVFASSQPEKDEREIHQRLAPARLEGREFFKIRLEEAVRAVASTVHDPPKYLWNPGLLTLPPIAPEPRPSIRPRTPTVRKQLTPEEEAERLKRWKEKVYRE